MKLKRTMGVLVIGAVSLFASDIVVDGSYSKLLGNPFKAKLEKKTQDMNVVASQSKKLDFVVETNRNDFSFNKPAFSIDASSCANVLKTFLAEDYNIVSGANNSATCEILNPKVTLTYIHEQEKWLNQLSDIVVEMGIRVKVVTNGVVKEFTVNNKMDKTLGKKGDNYNFTIRAAWNPDYSNVEQNIHKIAENSIYEMLNKNLGGVQ
ncbi:hypothetical protein [Sulfurospirillum sp. UCH001]|uniref:hypothetical protein n=1 Tax=Sulfurospirillum sp. UCH001 TaxID=1581011 RepID=UPI000831B037|nr:hypothetical protein [Sulfurospirillum sp. UCH001]